MVQATATTYKPTPRGTYRGKLTAVEEKKNDSGYYWIWSFTLLEDVEGDPIEEEFEKFTATSSTNFGPKSKARNWVHGMIGRALETDETIDFDESLVGRVYILNVGINEETQRNTLDSLSPAKRAPQAPQRPASAPAASQEGRVHVAELDDRPWDITPEDDGA